jgi:hypothetical protein
MAPTINTPAHRYPSQGRCIFCLEEASRTKMTDEHVIPYALSGTGEMIIDGGSCDACNKFANVHFESSAFKTAFKTARILLELKRNRRKRNMKPLKLPPVAAGDLVDGLDEVAFNIELSREEYPNLITLTMFPLAGKLLGVRRTGDLTSVEPMTFNLGPKQHAVQNVTTREPYDHTAFSLTIAKMAYSFAVAECGLSGFDGDEIRALLKCERKDVYNFVGGILKPQHFTKRYLHNLYIHDRDGLLTVIVHLFASCGMAPYEVVVGRRAYD